MITPENVRDFFAEIFSRLDAEPRPLKVKIDLSTSDAPCRIDLVRGEPVFYVGEESLRANFRGRYLAKHAIPLALKPGLVLTFSPTTNNRVCVDRG